MKANLTKITSQDFFCKKMLEVPYISLEFILSTWHWRSTAEFSKSHVSLQWQTPHSPISKKQSKLVSVQQWQTGTQLVWVLPHTCCVPEDLQWEPAPSCRKISYCAYKTRHLTCGSFLFEEGGGSIKLLKTGIKQIAHCIYLSKATCHPLYTLWKGGRWDHEVMHGFHNSPGSWEAWHRGVQELCPWEGTAAAGTSCTHGHGTSRAVHPRTRHQPCP